MVSAWIVIMGSVVLSLRHALQVFAAARPGGAPTLIGSAVLTGMVVETPTTLAPGSWFEVTGASTLSAGSYVSSAAIVPEMLKRSFRLRS